MNIFVLLYLPLCPLVFSFFCRVSLSLSLLSLLINCPPLFCPQVGAIDPFHAHRCCEIVSLTEAALQEPAMASELRYTAAKVRAKLYFLSIGAGSSEEGGGGGKGSAIKATAGDIVRFQVYIFVFCLQESDVVIIE